MEYKLSIPEGYQKIKVPDLNTWLTALRSGNYMQGFRRLCSVVDGVKHYCCLGVRLETQGKLLFREGDERGWDANDSICRSVSAFCTDNPDFKIFDGLGRFADKVSVSFVDKEGDDNWANALYVLNDSEMPFTDIADIIETLYEEA